MALDLSDLDTTISQVEAILGFLADRSLYGALYPNLVHLTCIHVLRAAGDPRADEILICLYDLLQSQVAKFPEKKMQDTFLSTPAHQEMVRL